MSTIVSIIGGLGLFLLGMGMMTDGLKLAAGDALRTVLESWTRTRIRGFLAGILITALVQSSSAVTVATVGFVNAGLLTLSQAVWVIFGTNVGTTMTGWLVAFVGIKVDVGLLALPMIGLGMLIRLASVGHERWAAIGQAMAGFGAFFLGVNVLQEGFAGLAPEALGLRLDRDDGLTRLVFVGVGFLLTVLTQSSSAAIAITLTASAHGALPLETAAAAVIGTNVGTTSTALLATIGATSPSKRVAVAHVAFNVVTGGVALLLLPLLLFVTEALVATDATMPSKLAVFHTLFNVLGVILMWPATGRLVGWLSRRFVTQDETLGRPAHLDATLLPVPSLAVRGLALETDRLMRTVFALAQQRVARRVDDAVNYERQLRGARALGGAIRAFIEKLSRQTLPDDAIRAISDILRATQHVEDLIDLITRLPVDGVHSVASSHWQDLLGGAMASFTPTTSGDALSGNRLGDLAQRTEAAYEGVKADLLRESALGRLHVTTMEHQLLAARTLRRCADSARKAQRRLLPWLDAQDEAPSTAPAERHVTLAPD